MDQSLKGKSILIGVSAGIAAYKTCYLVSRLAQSGANVKVVMTKNAAEFVSPLTFETISGNRCITDMFDRNFDYDVKHVSLAKGADLVMVAPATADVIAKFAGGIADDMLTTTFLACNARKIVAPAMNTAMFENEATQDNIKTLEKRGVTVIKPASGHLACGDHGAGKMPEPEELYKVIADFLSVKQDLQGKKVMVTCGATREALDPVRFITNGSTGRMGIAIAEEAASRGAEVTLVKASTEVPDPEGCEIVNVVTASDMKERVLGLAKSQDIIVMAAAVSDYTPKEVSREKIKKSDGELTLTLKRTTDILSAIGEMRESGEISKDTFICGFSMETNDLIKKSEAKLRKKKCDMIVANDLNEEGAGFACDTNKVAIITNKGTETLELMSKKDVAKEIIARIAV